MASEEKGCPWCSSLGMYCGANCVLPPLAGDQFAAVLRVFGARNLRTLFAEFEPQERAEVAERLVTKAIADEEGGVDFLRQLLEQSKGDDAAARVVFDDLAKAEEGRAVAKDAASLTGRDGEEQQVAAAAPSSSTARDGLLEETIQEPDSSAFNALDPMSAPPVDNLQIGRAATGEQRRAPETPNSPPRLPPPLPEDPTWEILLRLSPREPETRVHAQLVCTVWRDILTNPAFVTQYRAFHRTPPLLGLIVDTEEDEGNVAVFIPTTRFRPSPNAARRCRVLDCRHGRVLLFREDVGRLLVWNPLTGQNRLLPVPAQSQGFDDLFCAAAVLCAAGTDCDHLSCGRGHFLVVMVTVEDDRVHAWLFSSETGEWSARASTDAPREGFALHVNQPPAVSGDFVFFQCEYSTVLMYCTFDGSLMFVEIPLMEESCGLAEIRLLPEVDGLFRLATLYDDTLTLWSIDEVAAEWKKANVLKLPDLLPFPVAAPAVLGGVADLGNCIFFLGSNGIVTSMDLTSFQTTRVWSMGAPVLIFGYCQHM